jgi:pimeloyl-ACP methyl ester carboxylesterase
LNEQVFEAGSIGTGTWTLGTNSFSEWGEAAPACTVCRGEEDGVIAVNRDAVDGMGETVPNLKKKVLLPGAGHWIQQERPTEVNQLLIEFLASLNI